MTTPQELNEEHPSLYEHNPNVSQHGVPGFHHKKEDGQELAAMELDRGAEGRVNTGTGDQPGNTHGDRFATPNQDPRPRPDAGASPPSDRDIIRRFVREIFELGRMDTVDELLAPEFRSHTWNITDRDGMKEAMRHVAAGLSDARMTIEDMIAADHKVIMRLTAEARHVGPFMGLPASNRSYRIGEIHIFRLHEGSITEHWHQADLLGMMQQLGAFPVNDPTDGTAEKR